MAEGLGSTEDPIWTLKQGRNGEEQMSTGQSLTSSDYVSFILKQK
jgi:hypothetical protein